MKKMQWIQSYNDENWEAVNVPHTWNAIDGANGFDFYKGACWYRKEFTIDTVLKEINCLLSSMVQTVLRMYM